MEMTIAVRIGVSSPAKVHKITLGAASTAARSVASERSTPKLISSRIDDATTAAAAEYLVNREWIRREERQPVEHEAVQRGGQRADRLTRIERPLPYIAGIHSVPGNDIRVIGGERCEVPRGDGGERGRDEVEAEAKGPRGHEGMS